MKIIRYIRTILFYLSLPIFYILGRLFPVSNIKNEESEFIDYPYSRRYIPRHQVYVVPRYRIYIKSREYRFNKN